MRIILTKQDKVALLKAISEGVFDTNNLPELKKVLGKLQPDRLRGSIPIEKWIEDQVNNQNFEQ